VLVGSKDHLEGPAFAKFSEKCRGKSGGFELPPSCDVQSSVRRVLSFGEAAPELGEVERVSMCSWSQWSVLRGRSHEDRVNHGIDEQIQGQNITVAGHEEPPSG
jgi:hypothetical protein